MKKKINSTLVFQRKQFTDTKTIWIKRSQKSWYVCYKNYMFCVIVVTLKQNQGMETDIGLDENLHVVGTWTFLSLRPEAFLLHIVNGRLLDNHEQSITPPPQGRSDHGKLDSQPENSSKNRGLKRGCKCENDKNTTWASLWIAISTKTFTNMLMNKNTGEVFLTTFSISKETNAKPKVLVSR